ncbi:MAG: HAD-IC family P-type ATPase [Armatimonadetes bacterium]|nr:HAD-IC family P-type ATPase [Armatimonadota bacterium]
MQTLLERHWHHLSAEAVLELLDTTAGTGLDQFEVRRRQQHFGRNEISPRRGPSRLTRFAAQFRNPLIIVLLGSSAITALIKDPVDAVIILAVVLINAVIGYVQEAKAEKAIEALAQSMTTEATVLRAGERLRLSAAELVPGDVVEIQAGDKVPADLRLVRSRDLQVAEAALTGESAPVTKDGEDRLPAELALAERRTMLYASTLVTYGQGLAVVVATGDGTEVGRISQLITAAADLQTPLTARIAAFTRVILYAVLALAGLTFAVGLLRGQPALDTFTAAVALAVAMIPEGLPAALTVTLAIGVARMARRRAIIRRLPAVETLGGATVICSDKTGTLTQNQMTTQRVIAGGRPYRVTGAGYEPNGDLRHESGVLATDTLGPALRECLVAGLLCNDAELVREEGQWQAHGDPTEIALLVVAAKAGLDLVSLRGESPRLDAVPFDSQHQYMATLHTADEQGTRVAYVKGALEVVLARCDRALGENGVEDALNAEQVRAEADQLAAEGLRVLALARKAAAPSTATLSHDDVASGLVFLGVQAIIDPPRAEVIAALRACREAGIQVKMITGDHPLTAAAIAAQVGLGVAPDVPAEARPHVLAGHQLAALSDTQLVEAAAEVAVFARVSPEQKLRLVEALQARGNVVAMTGDGVNDGPALKQADIGIAMGIAGTEVAKEAADMVLTDDNFATIEAAVEEGRGVFDNLMKIIVWALPTNLGQGLILLLAIVLGIALPILPVQILWINTVTAGVLGLVLALEPREPGLMSRPPRAPDAPLLTRDLVARVALVGVLMLTGAFGLYEVAIHAGRDVAVARTLAVNAIVGIEIAYLFNCRSLHRPLWAVGISSNPSVLVGVAIMIALQLLFSYAPLMNTIFLTAPVGQIEWVWVLVVSLAAGLMVEAQKALQSRSWRSRGQGV